MAKLYAWLILAAAMFAGIGCSSRSSSELQAADAPTDGPSTDGAPATGAPVKSAPSAARATETWQPTVRHVRRELEHLADDAGSESDPKVLRDKLRSLADDLKNVERWDESGNAAGAVGSSNEKRDTAASATSRDASAASPAKHPFAPAIDMARASLKRMDKIKDYSAVIVKRERIDGRLNDHEYMFAKIRHDPFSVYLRFLGPAPVKGREVIYVAGRNDGNLLAHEPEEDGVKGALVGAIGSLLSGRIKPDGIVAMRGNRYPITEIGMLNLTRRLIEVGEKDMKRGVPENQESEAKRYDHAKVNDRRCTAYVFIHPARQPYFTFHRAEIFVDREWELPIRYAAYEWPAKPGGDPVLLEEYTYTRLRLNVGLTDADFDEANANYHFPISGK